MLILLCLETDVAYILFFYFFSLGVKKFVKVEFKPTRAQQEAERGLTLQLDHTFFAGNLDEEDTVTRLRVQKTPLTAKSQTPGRSWLDQKITAGAVKGETGFWQNDTDNF